MQARINQLTSANADLAGQLSESQHMLKRREAEVNESRASIAFLRGGQQRPSMAEETQMPNHIMHRLALGRKTLMDDLQSMADASLRTSQLHLKMSKEGEENQKLLREREAEVSSLKEALRDARTRGSSYMALKDDKLDVHL